MSLSPNIVSFNYKKGDPIPAGVQISHSSGAYFEGTPDWLEWYNVTATNSSIRVKASGADNLYVGNHSVNISAYVPVQGFDPNFLGNLSVNITVTEPVILSVSPSSLTFDFEIGGNTPSDQNLSVVSENSWTVTTNQAWLSASPASGLGSGLVTVSVDPTGLSENLYTGSVTINDGVGNIVIPVSFNVGTPNTGTDYLYVNPTDMIFAFTVGGDIPNRQDIDINSSAAWTATVSQPWLELTSTSGASGVQTIQLGLKSGVDLDALTAGDYLGIVTIAHGTFNRTINIVLNIYNFTTQLPSNAEILFTDEENIVQLSSSRLDSYMKVEMSSLYNNKLFSYVLKLPIFKGGALRDLGEIPRRVIGDPQLIDFSSFNVFQPYTPVEFNLVLKETQLFSNSEVATTNVNGIKFIKGNHPVYESVWTENQWLSETGKTKHLTSKGVVVFSILSKGTTTDSIKITGDYEDDIDVTDAVKSIYDFYTVVIPISTFGQLDEGNELDVGFFNETVKVVIRDEGVDHTLVFWENNNGCIDVLEFIGEVDIRPSYNRDLYQFRKSLNVISERIIDVDNPIEYKVNTGFCPNQEQVESINNMLQSNNIWLVHNGETIKVNPTTRKISLYRSLRQSKTFDITFKTQDL